MDVLLQNLYKSSNMIPVANSMMHLHSKRQRPSAVAVKKFSHRENRNKMLPPTEYIDIKRSKGQPRDHGNIKGVGRSVGFGRKFYRGRKLLHIRLIGLQKFAIIAVKFRPDCRNIFTLAVKNHISEMHCIGYAQSLPPPRLEAASSL